MITTTLIIFLLASGDSRAIYGTDSQCALYKQMQLDHALFVDDVDLPRQQPVEVRCQCAEVDMEPEPFE